MKTSELLRSAAEAAATNADMILCDAQLLLDARRFPRALSLAVIGYEEVGKALLFTLAATGRVPTFEPLLLSTKPWENPAKHHLAKQFLVEIAAVMADHFREFGQAEDVHLLLATIAGEVEGRSVQNIARDYYKQLEGLILQDAPAQVPRDYTPEQRKWNGLYVDIQEGAVCRPKDISRLDAHLALKDLELALAGLQPLLSVLSDEARWVELLSPGREGP